MKYYWYNKRHTKSIKQMKKIKNGGTKTWEKTKKLTSKVVAKRMQKIHEVSR